MMATPVAISLVWTMMFHPQLGVLNYILTSLGLPPSSWVYWNTMQHRRSAADVFVISKRLAERAMGRAATRLGQPIPIYDYQSLAQKVAPALTVAYAKEIAGHTGLDFPERAKFISPLSTPPTLLGSASP